MMSSAPESKGPTSPTYDVLEVAFLAAEMSASLWGPVLKSVGRWQVEMAHLAGRQVRAGVTLSQRLLSAQAPTDVGAAYRDYWFEVARQCGDASRNISMALVRAAPHTAALQVRLVEKPPVHDRLQLLELPPRPLEKKVA